MVLNVRILKDAIACPKNFLSVYFLRLRLDDRKETIFASFFAHIDKYMCRQALGLYKWDKGWRAEWNCAVVMYFENVSIKRTACCSSSLHYPADGRMP